MRFSRAVARGRTGRACGYTGRRAGIFVSSAALPQSAARGFSRVQSCLSGILRRQTAGGRVQKAPSPGWLCPVQALAGCAVRICKKRKGATRRRGRETAAQTGNGARAFPRRIITHAHRGQEIASQHEGIFAERSWHVPPSATAAFSGTTAQAESIETACPASGTAAFLCERHCNGRQRPSRRTNQSIILQRPHEPPRALRQRRIL